MKVLVTGASGFVGQSVVQKLLANKHQVVVLTRNIGKACVSLGKECQYFNWNNTNELPPKEAFIGVDAVINLMGESIVEKRWSDEQKKVIYNSRIISTKNLVEALKSYNVKAKVLVSTSAVGIYGPRGDEVITEETAIGNDFLANLCNDWEKEALKAKDFINRIGIIRIGVVLGKNGGALKKMLPIFKMGAGGKLGNGKQVMSWIYVEDLANMFVEIVENTKLSGIFNGTSPQPVTNKAFTKMLGKVICRPTFACTPGFVIKCAFGEGSTVLLDGQRVLPKKFQASGFNFRHPGLEMALSESTK